jgi:hypothetical protein
LKLGENEKPSNMNPCLCLLRDSGQMHFGKVFFKAKNEG